MAIVMAVTGLLAACAGSAPEVPAGADGAADPALVEGREIYSSRCSSCHGNEGQGGRGKKLNDGAVLAAYPTLEGTIEVIADGKGSGMPAFGDSLDDDELEAVARYIREVLN